MLSVSGGALAEGPLPGGGEVAVAVAGGAGRVRPRSRRVRHGGAGRSERRLWTDQGLAVSLRHVVQYKL